MERKMMIIDCDTCKIGSEHYINFYLRKTHKMAIGDFRRNEKALGERCIRCLHNGMTGWKAKSIKTLYPDFQSLDLHELSDVVKTSTTQCKKCKSMMLQIPEGLVCPKCGECI